MKHKLLKDLTDTQTGVTHKKGDCIDVLISEVPRLQKEGYLAASNTPEPVAAPAPEPTEKTK